jgi:diketogulonate reductase-like aldo/keto reductase
MEKQVIAGRAKSIGLSNFNMEQITRILQNARISPTNLQIEHHVYLQQPKLLEFCAKKKITVCAYAPLGSPGLQDFMKKRSTGEGEER